MKQGTQHLPAFKAVKLAVPTSSSKQAVAFLKLTDTLIAASSQSTPVVFVTFRTRSYKQEASGKGKAPDSMERATQPLGVCLLTVANCVCLAVSSTRSQPGALKRNTDHCRIEAEAILHNMRKPLPDRCASNCWVRPVVEVRCTINCKSWLNSNRTVDRSILGITRIKSTKFNCNLIEPNSRVINQSLEGR